MRVFRAVLPLVVLVPVLGGCRKKEEIRVYRVAKEEEAAAPQPAADPHAGLSRGDLAGGGLPAGHPTTKSAEVLTGETPEGWEPGRVSSMRQASFLVKGTSGEAADISLVILRGGAGGVLDNVNRWRGQLGQPPLDAAGLKESSEQLETAAGEALVVDIEGLADGGDPAVDGRTVAAIVERPGETWFYKMRGNAGLVGARKAEFLGWVATVRPAGADDSQPAEETTTPAEGGGSGEEAGAGPAGPAGEKAPPGAERAAAGETPEPAPAETPAEAEPVAEKRGGVQWRRPSGWTEGPPQTMRLVTFAVGGPEGAGGEVTVVKLAGDGGGPLANLNRWRRQIGLAPIEADELAAMVATLEANGVELSVADLKGPDASTVAAWAWRDGESWFFKLTGPAGVVEAQREIFAGFLKSIEFVAE